ncbi:MAG: hypothetical protein Q9160_002240 [Pyrenula sp. 1 TL-2023]
MDNFRSNNATNMFSTAPALASNTSAGDDDSTEIKIAILSSMLPDLDQGAILDALVACDGSVEEGHDLCIRQRAIPNKILGKRKAMGDVPVRQIPLSFRKDPDQMDAQSQRPHNHVVRKGRTLHLFSPDDISRHTPCTIIHNFLPSSEATALLEELLSEATSFQRQTFKVFDNVVQSPHSSCFYVPTLPEAEAQKKEWIYNGAYLEDVREATPEMRKVSTAVKKAVNNEVKQRIRECYPGGRKLKYQSSKEWEPNAAFVNCYDGGGESVGYHSDQLTYLGPRAVIGSLSLGVAREFRVRKVVARPDEELSVIRDSSDSQKVAQKKQRGDEEGQISIHLPHNSLLVSAVDVPFSCSTKSSKHFLYHSTQMIESSVRLDVHS